MRWTISLSSFLLGKTLDFLKANVSIELTKEPIVKEEDHDRI